MYGRAVVKHFLRGEGEKLILVNSDCISVKVSAPYGSVILKLYEFFVTIVH